MTRFLVCFTLLGLLATAESSAQYRENDEFHEDHQAFNDPERRSPNRSASLEFGSGDLVVEWGAPSVRGRELFGRLVPAGEIWRAGANEATVIHFPDDVLVEGQSIPAGNYALFAIGSADEFTFIFNSEQYQWGAFSHDPEKDVLRVSVATDEGEHQEELDFLISDSESGGAQVTLAWGTTRASFMVSHE